MTDLTKAIRQLEPLAQAIIVLAKHAADLEKIEVKVNELEGHFEQRKDEWAAAEVAAKKARASVEQANAEVIAAKARTEEVSKNATATAAKLMAEAKAEAQGQAKDISNQYKAEHARLNQAISEAKDQLAEVEGDIVEHQKVHDAVLASIETLSKRLVGAA